MELSFTTKLWVKYFVINRIEEGLNGTGGIMLNVALLNDSFTPQFDGVAVCAENYAKIIQREYGKSVVIVPEEKKRDIASFPYQVIEYPTLNATVADQYKIGLPISPTFIKEVYDLNINLVHSHTPFISGILAHHIASKHDIPHISTFHSKYKDDLKQRLSFSTEFTDEIITNYIATFYNHCDYVWTVSNGTAQTLQQYGYKGKIKVMPNGSDMEIMHRNEEIRHQIAESFHLDDNHPIFLFVGRLTNLKNIHLIAQALGALKRNGMKFSMLFVGSGEDEKKLVGLIKEHDLGDCVKLAGKILDRYLLQEIYSSSDLFIFPSVYDNAPLVVREAAACGCSSLLVKGSNSAEGVTNGVNGILVEERIEDITLGINDALTKYDLGQMGRNARRDLYLHWDDVLKMVVEEYNQILAHWKPKDKNRIKLPLVDIDLLHEIRSVMPKL
jgi:glycosyltransferase involved in cell wall biosynthesis